MYVRELVVSYRPKLCEDPEYVGSLIVNPRDGARILAGLLSDEAVEVFGVLGLTTKHQVLAYREIGRGTLNGVSVNAALVYQTALLMNAKAIIVAHCHPSGDPTPSPDDREVTRRLCAAGMVMDIELLDHVIVGHEGRYFSFQAAGEL